LTQSAIMNKFDVILFDVDGTIVDSRQDIVNAVNMMLKDFNLPGRSFDEIVSFIGNGLSNLLELSLGAESKIDFKKAKEVFEVRYAENVTKTSTLYPDVLEILEYYKNKKLYVITNRQTNMAKITLKHLGILGYFEDVFAGDTPDCIKPSPCSIYRALEAESADKDNCIIVGDMDVDIYAGKNAGITTCAVSYGLGKKEDLVKSNPDYMIDNILQLKNIIEG
jgi:phosphoglycolate phosphatase